MALFYQILPEVLPLFKPHELTDDRVDDPENALKNLLPEAFYCSESLTPIC